MKSPTSMKRWLARGEWWIRYYDAEARRLRQWPYSLGMGQPTIYLPKGEQQ